MIPRIDKKLFFGFVNSDLLDHRIKHRCCVVRFVLLCNSQMYNLLRLREASFLTKKDWMMQLKVILIQQTE